MKSDYDLPDQQEAVQTELESHSITFSIHEKGIYFIIEGIKIIFDRIKGLIRQDHLKCSDEKHKIRHIRLEFLSYTCYQRIKCMV